MEEQMFTLENLIKIKQVIELCKYDDNIILYKIYAKSFIKLCKDWTENRVLDENRINQIKEAYIKNDKVLLTSSFRVFYDKSNKELTIIDGHHRKKSLIELCKDDINGEFNPMILLVIHEFDNLNDDILHDLHIKSNMSKQLELYQIPSKLRKMLIDKIKKDCVLSNGISKTVNAKTARYPKISLNELAELSGKILLEYPELKLDDSNLEKCNIKLDEIIVNLKKINNYLSLIFINDNFRKLGYGLNKKEIERINKCFEFNFYLNMVESPYSIENWFKYIKNPEEYFIQLQIIID